MNRWINISGALVLGLGATPSLGMSPAAQIASAISAAPAKVASGAAVIDGSGKLLRKGSNGWTCMADNPVTPGADPMCLDKVGLDWAMAWMGHKAPPAGVGTAYMLKGGVDASNIEPYAAKPTGGWVLTGPHVMILNAATAEASGFAGGAHPDTSQPYVMFGGTPYAHIMMPVR